LAEEDDQEERTRMKIACPLCRKVLVEPKLSLSSLPDSLVHHSLLSHLSHLSIVLDGEESAEEKEEEKEEKSECKKHEGERKGKWCKSSCLFLCGQCVQGEHKGHQCVNLTEEILMEEKGKVEEIRREMERMKEKTKEEMKKVEEMEEKISQRTHRLHYKISETFGRFNGHLDSRRDLFLGLLGSLSVIKLEALSSQKKLLDRSLDSLSASSSFVSSVLSQCPTAHDPYLSQENVTDPESSDPAPVSSSSLFLFQKPSPSSNRT
jgi:hypothetical protein